MLKRQDQKSRDRQRKAYVLAFPTTMDAEQVTSWIRSISGTLAHGRGIAATPTIAFELWATSSGIQHRLKVPWQHADYIVSQLRSLVPGIRVTPDEEYPRRLWTRSLEAGMSNSGRTLRIYDANHLSVSLLSAVIPLEAHETVMVQWVVSPAIPRTKPEYKRSRTDRHHPAVFYYGTEAGRDEINDRRAKLEEPNVLAVLRVAAVANTPKRANHLIYRVRAALSATRTSSTRLTKRAVTQAKLQQRIDHTATPMRFPMQLNAQELTALLAWPIGAPMLAGLPPAIGKQYPPSDNIPREGIVIGNATFSGAERPLAIGYDEALMHVWCGGGTGVGKTTLLANMARQIMDKGYGLVVIEQEGNLYNQVLDYLPKERIEDAVLLDVTDNSRPPGLNILDQGHPLAVIDQLIDLFNHKYKESLWASESLYFGLRTIAQTKGLSFTDLPSLLVPKADEIAWVDSVTRAITDPELKRWWQRQDNRDRREQQQRADPILSRIWQLASRPELRYIFGQSESTFQISDVLRDGKILLVNLKGVSSETASLAGTLIMNAIWQATRTVDKTKPTFVLLDEFGSYADLPVDFESMLAQARKHNVGLILANQHLAQLTTEVREGLANARSKLVLATNGDDARWLSREMGNGLEPIDFTSLQKYEGIAQVLTPSGISQPVSLRTAAPQYSRGHAQDAIAHSRRVYGKDKAEVYADIENRHQPITDPNRQRPAIGSTD